MEQDILSPHLYISERVRNKLQNGKRGTILDLGSAEGNFSLMVSDYANELYLFEPDGKTWNALLEKTFEDTKKSTHIINAFVSDRADIEKNTISLDSFFDGKMPTDISVIKMDIEGAEINALHGMRETLLHNPQATLLFCVYHKKNDERDMRRFLEPMGYTIEARAGYMLLGDFPTTQNMSFRHGVIEAYREG